MTIKPRREPFNFDNLQRALQMLQPVTPTDDDHPAHWWSGDFGVRVINSMAATKTNVVTVSQNVKDKLEFQRKLQSVPVIVWPKHLDDDFWSSGFGQTIIKEWNKRWKEFTSFVASLQ